MGKYFGTDGFRGEANRELTSEHAYKIGKFLGRYYSRDGKRPRLVIGKDTRRSGYMLEYAVAAGAAACGADVYMLHVTTTPSVSYITKADGFDAGIMITASHNPFYDNGIKIINRFGEKLDDEVTELIESYLDGNLSECSDGDLPLAQGEDIGRIVDYISGRNRYIAYLISLASHSFEGLKIGLDLANGASHMIARAVFGALDAQLTVLGSEPNGLNINKDCGSTHIEHLCALVKEKGLDVGFAFDGDADRCIAVDENGDVVDGDKIMYILARRLRTENMLKDDTVVSTVMSNSGFVSSLKKQGISCVQTKVGDRYVYECMHKHGYTLGGEQSGHIIIKKYATTGDGILTALMLTEELCKSRATLSHLCKDVFLYPQLTKSIRVTSKDAVLSDCAVQECVKEIENKIGRCGRVMLRKSGTEPVIRIMLECKSDELCCKYAEEITNVIRERGYNAD